MKAVLYPISAALPHRIAIVARPRGGDWLCDELKALSESGIDVLVSMLTSEEARDLGLENEAQECGNLAIEFIGIPILDRSVPSNKLDFLRQVDTIVERLRSGRSIGIHCRASIGRSSLLLGSVLIRLGWEVQQAFELIQQARGCTVPDTPEQKAWVMQHVPRGHEDGVRH